MYLNINDVNQIQLDHTGRCNLSCPQCARQSHQWSLKSSQRLSDLSVQDYQIILEPFEENKIKLFHCGNYGDALASPTFDNTFEYCLKKNVKHIKIATNGSLKTNKWWEQFALKGKDKLTVIFSIDGLADTNHVYRVGANWNLLLSNLKSFTKAGGNAEWHFIEFEHNQHQVHEIKQLANDIGVKKFIHKKSSRFSNEGKRKVKTIKGQTINQPKNDQSELSKSKAIAQYGDFDSYVNHTKINCKFKSDFKIFIDMEMKLWPCCWLGAPSYFLHKNKQSDSIKYLYKLYGNNFNDLRVKGWDVLNHDFFQEYLANSWDNPNEQFKRIYTCGRTCGSKYEFSSGHGTNITRDKLSYEEL
jgi:MoaA/NifB/PqqE/SkfB family radical SAM enzyme